MLERACRKFCTGGMDDADNERFSTDFCGEVDSICEQCQNAFQGTDFEAAFLAAGIWIHQSDFD